MRAVSADDDAAMVRIAASRDAILQQSNRFLIVGMILAVLYGIKAVGLRLDLVLFDAKIFDVPYGLFVFCILGSGSFLIAQTRFMDAHALDRRLYSSALRSRPDDALTYYQTFPSESFWLELTREQFFAERDGAHRISKAIFAVVGILMLVLYFAPVIASAHYLLNWPALAGEQMISFQWWSVLSALILDVSFFIFVQRVYSLGSK